MSLFYKDPDAELDYTVEWGPWLGRTDSIQSSEWLVPDDLKPEEPRQEHDLTGATVWLAGGTVGQTYEVTNRITTAGGRTNDRTIRIRIVQK